jgi:hypothetical protein
MLDACALCARVHACIAVCLCRIGRYESTKNYKGLLYIFALDYILLVILIVLELTNHIMMQYYYFIYGVQEFESIYNKICILRGLIICIFKFYFNILQNIKLYTGFCCNVVSVCEIMLISSVRRCEI